MTEKPGRKDGFADESKTGDDADDASEDLGQNRSGGGHPDSDQDKSEYEGKGYLKKTDQDLSSETLKSQKVTFDDGADQANQEGKTKNDKGSRVGFEKC